MKESSSTGKSHACRVVQLSSISGFIGSLTGAIRKRSFKCTFFNTVWRKRNGNDEWLQDTVHLEIASKGEMILYTDIVSRSQHIGPICSEHLRLPGARAHRLTNRLCWLRESFFMRPKHLMINYQLSFTFFSVAIEANDARPTLVVPVSLCI